MDAGMMALKAACGSEMDGPCAAKKGDQMAMGMCLMTEAQGNAACLQALNAMKKDGPGGAGEGENKKDGALGDDINCGEIDECRSEAQRCANLIDFSDLTFNLMMCIMRNADNISDPNCQQCVQNQNALLCTNEAGDVDHESLSCQKKVRAVAKNKTCREEDNDEDACGDLAANGCMYDADSGMCKYMDQGAVNCMTKEQWTPAKTAYCCMNEGLGCPTCKPNKKEAKNIKSCASFAADSAAALSERRGEKVCVESICAEKPNARRRLLSKHRNNKKNKKNGVCALTEIECHPCYAVADGDKKGCRKVGKKVCKFKKNKCGPNPKYKGEM